MAYAVPSSLPYSWQNGGDFLSYTQWKHGATWAVADYYLGSCDAETSGGECGSNRGAGAELRRAGGEACGDAGAEDAETEKGERREHQGERVLK